MAYAPDTCRRSQTAMLPATNRGTFERLQSSGNVIQAKTKTQGVKLRRPESATNCLGGDEEVFTLHFAGRKNPLQSVPDHGFIFVRMCSVEMSIA